MRKTIALLSLLLASCSALPSAQRFGVPTRRTMITGSKVVYDAYQASDDDNAAGFKGKDDPDVDGWDLQLDLYFNGPSALVGYSKRDYGDRAEATEFYGGGRYFFGGSDRSVYLMGIVRWSDGLELSGSNSDSYLGYGVGGGSTAQMTENLFLDFRLLYERLVSEIEVGTSEVEIDGLVGSVGIAIVQ